MLLNYIEKKRMAGELGFSHDFNALAKSLEFPIFPAASDRGRHLCALALGISQYGARDGNYFRFPDQLA
jgi:hypothetical protein